MRVGLGMESSLAASSLQKAVLREIEMRSVERLKVSGTVKEGGEPPVSKSKLLAKKLLSVRSLAITLVFGGIAGFVRALLKSLPPDFFDRWNKLIHDQPLQASKPVELEAQPATVIYDCHGVVLARIVQRGYRTGKKVGNRKAIGTGAPLHPSDIPSTLWQAVVASEDRRFFEHRGVDPKGLARAILSLTSSGGGSTITQQLVKNVFLSNDRKWTRKLMEMILAVMLERQMSKWDILHHYLNKSFHWIPNLDNGFDFRSIGGMAYME